MCASLGVDNQHYLKYNQNCIKMCFSTVAFDITISLLPPKLHFQLLSLNQLIYQIHHITKCKPSHVPPNAAKSAPSPNNQPLGIYNFSTFRQNVNIYNALAPRRAAKGARLCSIFAFREWIAARRNLSGFCATLVRVWSELRFIHCLSWEIVNREMKSALTNVSPAGRLIESVKRFGIDNWSNKNGTNFNSLAKEASCETS